MIGSYCRKYRMSKGITLSQLTNGGKIKTLSAFEMGRSSNIHHLELYIKLSHEYNDEKNFMDGLLNNIVESRNGNI